jgi:hypothetical protein
MGGLYDPPSPPDIDAEPPNPEQCCPTFSADCQQLMHDRCDLCGECATCELIERQQRAEQARNAPPVELEDGEECPF